MRFLNPNKVNLMFRLFRNVSRTSTGSRWLRRPLPLLAVGVAALLSASPATSADYRWRFNSSGSYLTPSNWELWTGSTWVTSPGIPGPSDRIFFDLNSSPSGYASSAIPRQVQSVTVMSGATGTLGFGFQSLQVGLGGMTIGSNAQLNLLNGTFSSSNVNLSSNGTLVVSGTSTSLTTSFIGTGNVASLDAGRLEVTSGANVSAGTLAHTTSSVDSQDNYHIVGASVTVSNSLALTNYSAKVRVGNDGLLDAGNATGATAFIHTVALDNGVFLGRAVNITNLVGHGIYASTDGAISNNQAGVAPTGAVVLDVSRNLQIRDTYAFAFSNAVPQIRGAITLGGGSFTTGSRASAHGLELVGTGKIVGFGTLNLNDGGLVGASTSIVEATGGTLQIQQNGNSVFGGAFAGTGEIEKTGAGHLALEGSAANYTHTGRIRVSDGTLTARRETTNPIKGLVTVDGGNLHIETSNQIVDNSMVTVDRGRFRINGGTNGISESIALLIGNGGAVQAHRTSL